MKQLVKQLAIPLSNQRTVAKWLVIAIPLSPQAGKWLVMRRCGKNFLLTYHTYAALRNFSRALLTIPHGMFLPVADRRPLVGHFRGALEKQVTYCSVV